MRPSSLLIAMLMALAAVNRPGRASVVRTWIGTSRGENGKTRVTFVWEPLPKALGEKPGSREEPAAVNLFAVAPDGSPLFRGTVPSRITFDVNPGKVQIRMNVTGAASVSLLALAELVLPALLHQRAIGVGWAGPLLAGFSVSAALGAILYALRGSWPGSLRAQSVVLLVGMTGCVALVATATSLAWMAVPLVLAGLMQAGVQLARNLSLRQALPSRAHAAGYSVLYAATGVGYAGSAILAGTVQRAASPEVAILAGSALTLLLTAVSALAEFAPRWRAPVRRSVNPVIDGRECASEPRLRPGRRPRAATSSRWGLPSAWASG